MSSLHLLAGLQERKPAKRVLPPRTLFCKNCDPDLDPSRPRIWIGDFLTLICAFEVACPIAPIWVLLPKEKSDTAYLLQLWTIGYYRQSHFSSSLKGEIPAAPVESRIFGPCLPGVPLGTLPVLQTFGQKMYADFMPLVSYESLFGACSQSVGMEILPSSC